MLVFLSADMLWAGVFFGFCFCADPSRTKPRARNEGDSEHPIARTKPWYRILGDSHARQARSKPEPSPACLLNVSFCLASGISSQGQLVLRISSQCQPLLGVSSQRHLVLGVSSPCRLLLVVANVCNTEVSLLNFFWLSMLFIQNRNMSGERKTSRFRR